LLALASIILIGLVMVRETNRHCRNRREERTQPAAIMRLLDEIEDLADGDLTVTATVTEDFTGAIADSINYRPAARPGGHHQPDRRQVAAAAQETQATAMHLAGVGAPGPGNRRSLRGDQRDGRPLTRYRRTPRNPRRWRSVP
jgi:twitching motility protein PilJ